ncbi:phospholipase B1, membrane-associated-like [Belonocnema kinseyi]|uniref:phospholipase B1, membrane-associated-like n=1 Tax=Belonocnema kinseyi TaxID=2817044 RepID=UPI00143CD50F|nr:phospholipase B1, membrane-associated-like [Belonocnema kinseyi]XP_033211067.1 phospholipase B1, membrane-associated-like [Belonocnema kinseyi]XP_033211068.1 phospholipase B1, membrane-associated-like [Belonocnema kinseyi]XP_033211069.1 phospholipase B1, membrane-associated-like [Belonocnema kinseyi]
MMTYILGIYLAITFIIQENNADTFSDVVRELLVSGRDDLGENGIVYPKTKDSVRRQPRISKDLPFPCDVRAGRSSVPPSSINRLRPGDIDVVAGLGDSLMAGSGAMEEFAIGAFIEARGVSWCVGGQADWRTYLTVPNLMKVFNPKLTGYSTGTGEFISKKARLNIAFPVAATEDALHQARILVNRIKSDPNIDVKKHWKMVTIFFGANDICSAQCYNPKDFSPLRHAIHLRRTLDFLRTTLPRTLVNLVPTIDVTVSLRSSRSPMCNILHPLYCACMHQGKRSDIEASKMSRLYQQAAEALVTSGRYDTTSDFTVVLQPFMKLFNAPNSDPNLAPRLDSTFVTHDCFHFSQKGHALGANLLWNNMLQPVGNKTDAGMPSILATVLCPSEQNPYIFTNINSKFYFQFGNQEGLEPR